MWHAIPSHGRLVDGPLAEGGVRAPGVTMPCRMKAKGKTGARREDSRDSDGVVRRSPASAGLRRA